MTRLLTALAPTKFFSREALRRLLPDNGAPQSGKPAAQGAAEQEGPDFTDILMSKAKDILLGSTGPRGGHREGIVEKVVRQSGEKILRGILGSLLGGKK